MASGGAGAGYLVRPGWVGPVLVIWFGPLAGSMFRGWPASVPVIWYAVSGRPRTVALCAKLVTTCYGRNSGIDQLNCRVNTRRTVAVIFARSAT